MSKARQSEAKTVREVLVAARWILANVGWTTAVMARDASGTPMRPRPQDWQENRPSSFCALGATAAVIAVEDNLVVEAQDALCEVVMAVRGMREIGAANDSASYVDEVLAWFDKAIAAEGPAVKPVVKVGKGRRG